MIMKEIPKVRYAVIGGSGTWAGEYPENTGIEGIRILQRIHAKLYGEPLFCIYTSV